MTNRCIVNIIVHYGLCMTVFEKDDKCNAAMFIMFLLHCCMQLKAGEVHVLATVAFALVKPDRTSEVRLVGLKLLQVNRKCSLG